MAASIAGTRMRRFRHLLDPSGARGGRKHHLIRGSADLELQTNQDNEGNAMKRTLFATTAAVAMAATTAAADVTVFGDARLGLCYNVLRNGDIIPDQVTSIGGEEAETDEIRAIARVRFGVRMTGETPTGITFGATIRADNAIGGAGGGAAGNTAGNAFVSGIFGTLTYGDTNSAHQQHAGDLPEIGLTGLGFFNELPYKGNRYHLSEDPATGDVLSFRPIVRYDFDVAGFGVSLSTDSELNDIGVGASFGGEFAGGTFSIGGGYYDDSFFEQWVAGISGGFAGFTGNVVYTNVDGGLETIGVGLGTTFADIGFNAYYNRVLSSGFIHNAGDFFPGFDFDDDINVADGDDAYGIGMNFDLGGGASLRGGYVRSYQGTNAADLGIQMAF
jgi:outer membrane protein OmpU